METSAPQSAINALLKDPTVSLFLAEFAQGVFQFLGIIYFIFLLYWLFSLRDDISERNPNGADTKWMAFCGAIGLGFALAAGWEWGWPMAGTAVTLGLCIGMALANQSVAACLLASSLFLRPWELLPNDPYLSMLPRLSLILCLGHLCLYFAQKRAEIRNFIPHFSKTAMLLGLFLVWCFVTTLFAPDPSASQSVFFDQLFKSVLLFFILVQTVHTAGALRRLLVTLLISFLSVSAISIYQSVSLGEILAASDFRLIGFGAFKNSNDIAALMVLIFPISAAFALRKSETWLMRALAFSLTFASLLTIALSRSRGGILGIAGIIGIYLILRIGRRALVPVAVGVTLMALAAMVVIAKRSSTDLEGSSAGRKTYLVSGLRMGAKNPVFGVGFDAFPASLQRYSTDSLEEATNMTAHNSWILVFAETGVMGLLIFCGILYFGGLSAWQVYRKSPEYLLSMVGYGVTIFFLSHSYLIYPYLLLALAEIARRTEDVPHEAPSPEPDPVHPTSMEATC